MEAGRYIEILNPYEWLPGYGENSITLVSHGINLDVIVEYEDESGGVNKKVLCFKSVCAFYKNPFPSLDNILNITYSVNSGNFILGSLVEFPDSEAAILWTKHSGSIAQIKHYKIVFMSENIMLDVFAELVLLKDI